MAIAFLRESAKLRSTRRRSSRLRAALGFMTLRIIKRGEAREIRQSRGVGRHDPSRERARRWLWSRDHWQSDESAPDRKPQDRLPFAEPCLFPRSFRAR